MTRAPDGTEHDSFEAAVQYVKQKQRELAESAIKACVKELCAIAERWTKRCDDAKRIPDAVIAERAPEIIMRHLWPVIWKEGTQPEQQP